MGEEKQLEYIKVTIYTTGQGAEALSAVLPALGITSGLSVEDPADLDFVMASKEALVWDYIDIKEDGHVPDGEARLSFWLKKGEEPKVRELRIALMKLKSDEQYGVYGEGADLGRLWLDTEIVRDDWKDKYKEGFRAFSPCEGILVAPPWDDTGLDVDTGREGDTVRIVIDPGMAFGTGTHETTSMCLKGLKSVLNAGDSVLDAGTGSGILAIAAALLGAESVVAVEIDADAAESAAGNLVTNGVSGKVSLINGDLTAEGTLPPGTEFDLITANLACFLLEALTPVFKSVLREGGAMLLSGLLDAQEERALEALKNEGLHAVNVMKDGEWLMIEARK